MTAQNKIPFLDLVKPHAELEEEVVSVLRQTLRTAGFIGGPMVIEFERRFAEFCQARHCIGVGSGTDALRFALAAAGVGDGDTVITVPNTFIATTEAISQVGAQPEFVDVDELTYTMDPDKLKIFLDQQCKADSKTRLLYSLRTGRRVKAIVPVHLYGQMADMDAILALAKRHGLIVIEDACQAHGAEYFSKRENEWKRAGSIGHAAAFSFYPGKNLGACGEAGAVTTNDEAIANKVSMLRDHGQSRKYYHDMEGYNGRLDAIQAGILGVKLTHLSVWNDQRRNLAARYNELLEGANVPIIVPYEPPRSRAVYHLYVIRAADRDDLLAHLADAGIGAAIHYPIPLHLQNAYASLNYRRGDFPVAEKCCSEILSLPMYPQLSPMQQASVVNEVTEYTVGKVHSKFRLRDAEAPSAA
jgi:dTDP-4-amino-4,6-dideoxygalactose transaminase